MVAFAILEPVYDKQLIEKIVKRLEFGVPSSHRQAATNGATINREKIAKKVSNFSTCWHACVLSATTRGKLRLTPRRVGVNVGRVSS